MSEKLADWHVHLQEIRVHNPKIATRFKLQPGTARWVAKTPEQIADYVRQDNLAKMVAIYEDENLLTRLKSAGLDCDIRGIYFIRDVWHPDEAKIATLHQRGLFQGIKIHPVIDNFPLTSSALKAVLPLAREYNVPILFHSDDRIDLWPLTHPDLQHELVSTNPNINFIIGHGGAYGHPRMVGDTRQVRGYWDGTAKAPSRKWLIQSALDLACHYDNAWYELSIALNPYKSELIVNQIRRHPGFESKILIGSDHPIKLATAHSQVNALRKAGLSSSVINSIIQNSV